MKIQDFLKTFIQPQFWGKSDDFDTDEIYVRITKNGEITFVEKEPSGYEVKIIIFCDQHGEINTRSNCFTSLRRDYDGVNDQPDIILVQKTWKHDGFYHYLITGDTHGFALITSDYSLSLEKGQLYMLGSEKTSNTFYSDLKVPRMVVFDQSDIEKGILPLSVDNIPTSSKPKGGKAIWIVSCEEALENGLHRKPSDLYYNLV